METTDSEKRIGGFRVIQQIKDASGSQGVVYKAVCETAVKDVAAVGDVVALKVMIVQDEDHSQWRRLEKRTQDLARLNHPNIVQYRGCINVPSAFNDTHIVVQEFLEGETLQDRLLRNPAGLDVEEGLKVIRNAVDGLVYTSGCGIVHRDLKPGNIFLCLDAKGAIKGVKLIDFEIAKQEGGTATTAAGNMRGTFDYMAPDFLDPDFHGDEQSDVFSMGIVLHEAIAGATPYKRFDGDNRQANIAFISRWADPAATPTHVSSRVTRLLANAREVIAKAIARDRAERYASFEEFRKGLGEIALRELRNEGNAYRLEQYIGKGGFGEVYKARHVQSGEIVAIKRLLKPEFAARFKREAKVLSKLSDDRGCFVRLVDFFERTGALGVTEAFLVMEYLPGMPGSSLRDAIKSATADKKTLPFNDVIVAFVRYARGLWQMHTYEGKGIVHRDIKPSNLYFPAGRPDRAAIMDFGIAKDMSGTMTTTGQVPGTLDYMPPEVVMEEGNRGDSGMDIYALGLCLYEALTGKTGYPRLPTGTAGYTAFFQRAQSRTPPKFDDPLMQRHPELLNLLKNMTTPDAGRRIKDASIVADRLEELAESVQAYASGGEEAAAPDSRHVYPADDGKERRSSFVWIALAAAIVAWIGALWVYVQRSGWLTADEPKVKVVPRVFDSNTNKNVADGAIVPIVQTERQETNDVTVIIDDRPAPPPPEPKVGYVKFKFADGEICRFNGSMIDRRESRLPRAPGEYECEFSRTNMGFKVLRYSPQRVSFVVSNKAVTVVSPKDDWTETAAYIAERDEAERRQLSIRKNALTNEFWRLLRTVKPVAGRQSRLMDAAAKLEAGVTAKPPLISDMERIRLNYEVVTRQRWVVGAISNGCSEAIEVADQIVDPGALEVFEFKDGRVPEQWEAIRDGYEPKRLDSMFDGRELVLADSDFKLSKVSVRIPNLAAGVKCLVGGKVVLGEVQELPGNTVECVYRREGFKDVVKRYEVRMGRGQELSAPQPGDWVRLVIEKPPEPPKKPKPPKKKPKVEKRDDAKKPDAQARLEAAKTQVETKPQEPAKPIEGEVRFQLAEGVRCMFKGERIDSQDGRKLAPGQYECVYESDEKNDEGRPKYRPQTISFAVVQDRVTQVNIPYSDSWKKTGDTEDLEIKHREMDERTRNEQRVAASSAIGMLMRTKPVTDRRKRLQEAFSILSEGVASNLFDVAEVDFLRQGIFSRQNMIVGAVSNGCSVAISVNGRDIEPGGYQVFEFRDGRLPDRWEAVRKGCEPKRLDIAFDGRELYLFDSDFVFEVRIPELPEGVVCRVGGERVYDSVKRRSGETLKYSYERRGYDYDGETEYEVTAEEGQILPPPKSRDWKIRPVTVYVPQMTEGIKCIVEGDEVTKELSLKPGVKVEYVYKRRNHKDQEGEYEVKLADYQELPRPGPWERTSKVDKEEEDLIAREKESRRVAATNRFWRLMRELEPVAERRKRLDEAGEIIDRCVGDNLLSVKEARPLNTELIVRQRWMVGAVSNSCSVAIGVAGKRIEPGGFEVFVFKNGRPPERWEATRDGFKPKRLDVMFDGRELVLSDADFQSGNAAAAPPNDGEM